MTVEKLSIRISGMKSRKRTTVRLFPLLLIALCLLPAHADDRNLLPKYGNLPKTKWQKEADAVFIKGIDEDYHGDRKKASSDFALRGWQFLRQGDLDTAMKRFNQAWLLNNSNGEALWGMAAIEASAGKMDDSLKLFAEAESFMGDDLNFSIDHAKAVAMAGLERKDDALLKDAFARFDRIYKRAPESVLNLENWAIALFSLARYAEAWEKIKLAEATPDKEKLDRSFVAELEKRMPRPEK